MRMINDITKQKSIKCISIISFCLYIFFYIYISIGVKIYILCSIVDTDIGIKAMIMIFYILDISTNISAFILIILFFSILYKSIKIKKGLYLWHCILWVILISSKIIYYCIQC